MSGFRKREGEAVEAALKFFLIGTVSSALIAYGLSFIYGSYNGAMVVFLTEIMPVEVRTSGFSLAYSLATAIFGGFTPAISTYLIHATHNPAVPGLWLEELMGEISPPPQPVNGWRGRSRVAIISGAGGIPYRAAMAKGLR